MSIREAVDAATIYGRHYKANNEHPADIASYDKIRIARARTKALAALQHLADSDPDFTGIALTTDKLFAYIPPPQEYHRALVDLGIALFQLAAMREKSSADLRSWLQSKVGKVGYAVPKNCCNKALWDWQLQDIAKATGTDFDTTRLNTLSKIQAHTKALADGDELGTPFHVSGFISDTAVSFVDGCKPGRHKLFKTSTGYAVFKRCGRQVTVQTLRAMLGE